MSGKPSQGFEGTKENGNYLREQRHRWGIENIRKHGGGRGISQFISEDHGIRYLHGWAYIIKLGSLIHLRNILT